MTCAQGSIPSDHVRLTDAGWAYRTNADRGWVIYRDPATGVWCSREDAIRILEESNSRWVSEPKTPPASRPAAH